MARIKGGRKGELSASDYYVLAEFRFLMRHFLVFSENAARESGLAPQQHQALLAIKGFEEDVAPTVGDLAERLAIRHNSAVGLVDRLVRAGYLLRNTDANDRRRVALILTEKSDAILAGLSAAHRDELRHLTPSLKALFAKLER
jgi:DNA-binding MarR family transcriptional regulator